jgi:antitoxin component YwqK of YwqJK toxin-antitoxin module
MPQLHKHFNVSCHLMKESFLILLTLIAYADYAQELPRTNWYENGQKMSEEIQTDSKLTKYINYWTQDGFQTLKDGNGFMVEKMAFRTNDSTVFTVRDSLKNGRFISYTFENGIYTKVSTGTYKNGLEQGLDTMFFPSEKVYLTRTYVNDEESGQSTEYYENGKIKEQGLLKGFYKEGLWTYYDDAGIVTKTINYLHNNMSGQYCEFYPNGKLKVKGNYIVIRVKNKVEPKVYKSKAKSYGSSGYGAAPYSDKSFKHGIWLFYGETGEMKKQLYYSRGRLKRNGS